MNAKVGKPRYWMGEAPLNCDVCRTDIIDEFSDYNLQGAWGNVCPRCQKKYNVGYGTGRGQRYTKQPDGRWMKTAG